MIHTQLLRRSGLVVSALILIAGCSGSDNSASSTTEDLSGRPGNSVSEADPVTTDPVATTTELEVASSALETTTTVESAPATPAAETPEAEVADAIQFFNQQWKTCLEQLPNCDLEAVAERRGVDDVGVIVREAIRFNQNDYRATNIDAYTYSPSNVVVTDNSATATVCVTDPISLTEADGTIVDNTYFSYVVDWTLSKPADVWIVESRVQIGETVEGEENDLCVAT